MLKSEGEGVREYITSQSNQATKRGKKKLQTFTVGRDLCIKMYEDETCIN